jgi:hypothetical protein
MLSLVEINLPVIQTVIRIAVCGTHWQSRHWRNTGWVFVSAGVSGLTRCLRNVRYAKRCHIAGRVDIMLIFELQSPLTKSQTSDNCCACIHGIIHYSTHVSCFTD